MSDELIFPEKITDWNEEIIKKLIESGYEESQKLEFKEFIKSPENRGDYRLKIEKVITSFANAKGGFILFGISDDKQIKGVSLKKDQEINLTISQIISNTTPIPAFDAIRVIIDSKEIIIVQVYECMDKPVQCSDGSYQMRLNGQTVSIPRDYLRDMFVTIEIKKQRYDKLRFEIGYMLDVIEKEPSLTGSVALPPFHKLRLDELQQALSDYYGYFKDGGQDVVKNINLQIIEIRKVKRFFDTLMQLYGTTRWGNNWAELNQFFDNEGVKREFGKINGMLAGSYSVIKSHLTTLKEFY